MIETLAAPSSQPPKACLITGGADRLGRYTTLAMAQAGWDIAIHFNTSQDKANSLAKAVRAIGKKAVLLQADLGDSEQASKLVRRAAQALEGLCCLVNNASGFEFDRPEQPDPRLATELFKLNTIAPCLLTQGLYEVLKSDYAHGCGPAGVAIHLLDQKLANPNPDFFSYTLSKSALLEAMRLQAMALAPVLRVVGLAPGLTLPSGDQTQEEFQKTRTLSPLGETSRPEEVANAVVWLAQARAVTGTMLLVDGGQHLMAQPRDVMMAVRA